MLLFLDIISSIPEFCVIDDNKIILQQKITKSETDKLSDNIIQSYIEIDKRLNLTKNLKKISTTIGPGSYTSLRVGSAFISGLMISRNIPYYPLTIEDILNFNAIKHSKKNLGVFITSSNNQKFFCYKIFLILPNLPCYKVKIINKKLVSNFNSLHSFVHWIRITRKHCEFICLSTYTQHSSIFIRKILLKLFI